MVSQREEREIETGLSVLLHADGLVPTGAMFDVEHAASHLGEPTGDSFSAGGEFRAQCVDLSKQVVKTGAAMVFAEQSYLRLLLR
jgi:hypothetical protein